MDRELLIEIGCEEIPAGWLPGLTTQLARHLDARLKDARLTSGAPAESYSTPRRLTGRVARLVSAAEPPTLVVYSARAQQLIEPLFERFPEMSIVVSASYLDQQYIKSADREISDSPIPGLDNCEALCVSCHRNTYSYGRS